MGKASRAKRERREADAAQRVRAERFVAKVTRTVPVTTKTKAESAPWGPGGAADGAVFPKPAAKGAWGGPRPGSGRPRIYATGTKRQAAYRARLRARAAGEVGGQQEGP
ncbi:MAG: hypothetical protein ACYDHU_08020 [Acidimicrobiales bacterium]